MGRNTMARESVLQLFGLFILGFVLLNYPVMGIFDHDRLLAGMPVLYLYLFFVWIFLIVLTFRTVGSFRRKDP